MTDGSRGGPGGDKRLPVVSAAIPDAPQYVRLPRPRALFRRRAERLRALAPGHAAAQWLVALAGLCDAQHAAVTEGEHAWRAALARVVHGMAGAPLPLPAREALAGLGATEGAGLGAADSTRLDAWASSLRGDEAKERPPPSAAPFLAAALQVEQAIAAARIHAPDVARADRDCPVCRAPAVAGVVHDDGARYLHCSMCASAWHRARVQCVTCGETGKVAYFAIDGAAGAGAKAEACGACRTYLKLFYEAERPNAEPVADDLATIALDLLLGAEGYARGGVNLLLGA